MTFLLNESDDIGFIIAQLSWNDNRMRKDLVPALPRKKDLATIGRHSYGKIYTRSAFSLGFDK
jgi:hypothetical protein